MDRITQLLKLSLLEAVGDDAERADRLRAAGSALGRQFVDGDRGEVPAAVLAAVEPGDSDWSVFARAEQCLLEVWDTLPNAFSATPRELLRAVVLEAVTQAAETDEDLRLVAWYVMRSGIEQHGGGRWAPALQELLDEWADPMREAAAALWQPALASTALRMPSVAEPEPFSMKARTNLIQRAGDYSAAPNYQHFFTKVQGELADDITALINLAEGASFHGAKLAHDQLKDALKELGGKLRDAFELHEQRLEAVRLRGELLWWAQSRYSQTLERGYDELESPAHVALAAAIDLHELVPRATPVAVEHLLSHLVRSVTDGADPLPVEELAGVAQGEFDVRYEQAATPATLLGVATGAAAEALAPALAASAGLSPQRTSVLLFRDLQAAHVLQGDNGA